MAIFLIMRFSEGNTGGEFPEDISPVGYCTRESFAKAMCEHLNKDARDEVGRDGDEDYDPEDIDGDGVDLFDFFELDELIPPGGPRKPDVSKKKPFEGPRALHPAAKKAPPQRGPGPKSDPRVKGFLDFPKNNK